MRVWKSQVMVRRWVPLARVLWGEGGLSEEVFELRPEEEEGQPWGDQVEERPVTEAGAKALWQI